ncbi:DUF6114 domain-containing protein [Micromonospora mirobrigensis]|uniref:Uncharacterized protein n=1 Tax=Micromonospora mirobrigensis TaxID=262898 RepID=A0A1C4ZL61_9ACTN|nr:DUF6114 domain-containing protein [Micromonospora mirobrigensis]SCF33665.1 hypothetical protein GA0070564_10615 [Micromonospora mirobrigensis]
MTPVDPQPARSGRTTGAWGRFRRWRRSRPFWGGLLTVLAGVELFVSGKLTLAGLSLAVGPTGFLSWIIPVGLVTCGLLIWFSPSQRLFYAIIAAVTAVYSLKGLNLGGFFLGMLLGMVGSALAFAWTPTARPAPAEPAGDDDLTGPAGGDEFAGAEAVPAPRPAAADRTLVDELLPARDEGPPPGTPGARHRAVGFTAIGLTLAGLLTVQGPAPVRAAPTCPSTASATPSGRPAAPAPTPTGPTPTSATPSPADPTPGPTQGSGHLIGDLLDGIGDLLTGGRRTSTEPTSAPSGTPTAGASPGPDATSPTPTGSPKAGDPAPSTPAGRPSACPVPRPTTDPTPTPPGTARVTPGAPLPRIAADPGQPRVAEQPSKLTGTKVTMTGLRFAGIVELPTASGKLRALKFSMRRAVTDDFLLRAGGPAGTTAGYATKRLTVQGDVDFYATRFVGRLLGIKITLTPNLPIPNGIPITLPISITFTDPVIDLAYVSSNTLTAQPALRLTLT